MCSPHLPVFVGTPDPSPSFSKGGRGCRYPSYQPFPPHCSHLLSILKGGEASNLIPHCPQLLLILGEGGGGGGWNDRYLPFKFSPYRSHLLDIYSCLEEVALGTSFSPQFSQLLSILLSLDLVQKILDPTRSPAGFATLIKPIYFFP
jgi:hypothetical protein